MKVSNEQRFTSRRIRESKNYQQYQMIKTDKLPLNLAIRIVSGKLVSYKTRMQWVV